MLYTKSTLLIYDAILSSTGSAGLIQTVQMYARGAIVAGVLGTIATVGWVIQGVGNAYYYREVSVNCYCISLRRIDMLRIRSGHITSLLVIQLKRFVVPLVDSSFLLTHSTTGEG